MKERKCIYIHTCIIYRDAAPELYVCAEFEVLEYFLTKLVFFIILHFSRKHTCFFVLSAYRYLVGVQIYQIF